MDNPWMIHGDPLIMHGYTWTSLNIHGYQLIIHALSIDNPWIMDSQAKASFGAGPVRLKNAMKHDVLIRGEILVYMKFRNNTKFEHGFEFCPLL